MSKDTIILCGLLMVFVSVGSSSQYAYTQGTPLPATERAATGIPYVSSGVGLDERDALRALSGDYNLHVTSALREGNYLSDVRVAVLNAKAATILETLPQGPWLFSKLPPGKYTVVAEKHGNTQQRLVHVPTTGHAEVYFYW